jgi:hypothetical protein
MLILVQSIGTHTLNGILKNLKANPLDGLMDPLANETKLNNVATN